MGVKYDKDFCQVSFFPPCFEYIISICSIINVLFLGGNIHFFVLRKMATLI